MQKSGENLVQTFRQREVMSYEMLRNRDRFQDSQQDCDQELDRDIVSDMPGVPAALQKSDERFLDNFASPRDEVFGKSWLFAA